MIIGAVTIDSDNAEALSTFYQKLLGWEKGSNTEDGQTFIFLYDKAGRGPLLVFQEDPDYERPVWPAEPGKQQTMAHLDFFMTKAEYHGAVEHALACGATKAPVQYSEGWTVMLDPAGHPFCIDPVLPDEE